MATQQEILYQSQLEGASLALVYDDVTLIATGFIASVSNTASTAMKVHAVDKNGNVYDFSINPNLFNQVVNFPANRQLQGTRITTRFGTQTIDWGISSLSVSF